MKIMNRICVPEILDVFKGIPNGVEGCLDSTYPEFKKWLFDITGEKLQYKNIDKTNIDLRIAPWKDDYPKGPLPYSSNTPY